MSNLRSEIQGLVDTAFACVTAPDDAPHSAVPVEHLRAALDRPVPPLTEAESEALVEAIQNGDQDAYVHHLLAHRGESQ